MNAGRDPSPAPDAQHPTPDTLDRIVRERIRHGGPMTFAEFVALALYHPAGGYYTGGQPGMGRTADYLTAPEAHPVFGALIGRQLAHLAGLIVPDGGTFDVIELGAGTGALAAPALDEVRRSAPDVYTRLRYRIVEVSPTLRSVQADRLAAHCDRVDWVDLTDIPPGSLSGVVLANEFFDALPFHRVQVRDGEPWEVYVDLAGDELADRLGPPSTPALPDYFQKLGRLPPEGGQVEVSLAAVAVIAEVAAAIGRGLALTIDYGYEVDEWLGKVRPRGTFLAHHRHTTNDNPYRRIGRQDLTAQVDFTTLAQAGRRRGLAPLGLIDQRSYLLALGLPAYAEGLARQARPPADRRRDLEALAALIDPGGMGRFKVLMQARGLPRLTLTAAIDLPEPVVDPAGVPHLPAPDEPPDPFAALWEEAFGSQE
ncbi:MAG TPA: SAM-dependent methyltransferase [Dehalococcoidia bacterium]|nr:SAM-dependent methyltransferase [Dehalococcoidia bacterium]